MSILEKMRVPFSDFSVDVEASLSPDHPKIYEKVLVTYTIDTAAENRDKVQKAIQLSEEKYCGVMAMFRGFSEVTLKVNFL